MSTLVVCASCSRHVRAAIACPFCERRGRVVVAAAVALATSLAACGQKPSQMDREPAAVYGGPPLEQPKPTATGSAKAAPTAAPTATPTATTSASAAPTATVWREPAAVYGGPPVEQPVPQVAPRP